MAATVVEAPREACESQAAETIARLLTQTIQKKGKAVLGLGETKGLEKLFQKLALQNILWKQVHIVMTDERCVSLNSLESNYRHVHEHLLKNLIASKKLPEQNVHPFEYNETHAVKTIIKYQAVLDGLGEFDIVLIQGNPDSHIAALFPKHASVQKENTGFFLITNAPEHPLKRMTASRKLLLKASAGVLMLSDEKAWKSFNDPAKTVLECPLKLITQLPEHYIYKTI